MIDILSITGTKALQHHLGQPTLLAFDLDGTLAPIVPRPDDIVIPTDVVFRLSQLTEMTTTAVITGRSRHDAVNHLGMEPTWVIGNHGGEGLPGVTYDESASWHRQVSGWERQLGEIIPAQVWPDIILERKGISLSLHYRHARDTGSINQLLLDSIHSLTPPPRIIGGKFVINIIPEQAPDKGIALIQLMKYANLHQGLFVGDDETDESVFKLDNSRILSICIGTERPSKAKYFLHEQSRIPNLLDLLIRCHQTMRIKQNCLTG